MVRVTPKRRFLACILALSLLCGETSAYAHGLTTSRPAFVPIFQTQTVPPPLTASRFLGGYPSAASEIVHQEFLKRIRTLTPPGTREPEHQAEDIWRLFGTDWEEALSLLGPKLFDRTRLPLIQTALAAHLPIVRIADWVWFTAYYAKRFEDLPDALTSFLLIQSATNPLISSGMVWHFTEVYRLIPESRRSNPESYFLEHIERMRREQSYPPYNYLGLHDFEGFQQAVLLPRLAQNGPLQSHQLAFSIAPRRDNGFAFGVWLTDKGLIEALPARAKRHTLDDRLLIASVRFKWDERHETATITQIQGWLPLSHHLTRQIRQQLGNMEKLAERAFHEYIRQEGARHILAPALYQQLDYSEFPLHPNTIQRLNNVYRNRDYRLTLLPNGQWFWETQAGVSNSAMSLLRGSEFYEKVVAPAWESLVIGVVGQGIPAAILSVFLSQEPNWPVTLYMGVSWMVMGLLTFTITQLIAVCYFTRIHPKAQRQAWAQKLKDKVWTHTPTQAAHNLAAAFSISAGLLAIFLHAANYVDMTLPLYFTVHAAAYTLTHMLYHFLHNLAFSSPERMTLHKSSNQRRDVFSISELADNLMNERASRWFEKHPYRPAPPAAAAPQPTFAPQTETRPEPLRVASEKDIAEAMPWIRVLAFRLAKFPNIQKDDLIQEGVMAFLEAFARFDVSRDLQLNTFVSHRVEGAMKDYLRGRQAGRARRAQRKEIETKTEQLQRALGRAPEPEEVASSLGIPLRKLQARQLAISQDFAARVQDGRLAGPNEGSTHLERYTASLYHSEEGDPLEMQENREDLEHLWKSFMTLSPRFQLIMWLLRINGLTLNEVSFLMGVNESRISQINTLTRRVVAKHYSETPRDRLPVDRKALQELEWRAELLYIAFHTARGLGSGALPARLLMKTAAHFEVNSRLGHGYTPAIHERIIQHFLQQIPADVWPENERLEPLAPRLLTAA